MARMAFTTGPTRVGRHGVKRFDPQAVPSIVVHSPDWMKGAQ